MIIQINIFRGDLSDISAKITSLLLTHTCLCVAHCSEAAREQDHVEGHVHRSASEGRELAADHSPHGRDRDTRARRSAHHLASEAQHGSVPGEAPRADGRRDRRTLDGGPGHEQMVAAAHSPREGEASVGAEARAGQCLFLFSAEISDRSP